VNWTQHINPKTPLQSLDKRDRILRLVEKEFPYMEGWTYLNTATEGLLPVRSCAAMDKFLRQVERPGQRNEVERDQAITEAKRGLAILLNCVPSEVALTSSTSEGINIVTKGLGLSHGEVLVPDCEFPANVYPWLQLERNGVKVKFVRTSQEIVTPKEIKSNINTDTKLVAISHVGYASGFVCELEEIGEICFRRGIPLFVDASQSFGVVKIDVKQLKISFLASTVHKWLLGPYGLGVFFCKKELCKDLQGAYIGWRSIALPPETRQFSLTQEKEGATRFEIGTPNYPGIFALAQSVGLLLEIGMDTIVSRVTELTNLIREIVLEKGYQLSPANAQRHSGIVSFSTGDDNAIERKLFANKIIVAVRRSGIRASPHFFNTIDSVERLREIL
jgi:cysteine desulfurase/selenocysteine lyase